VASGDAVSRLAWLRAVASVGCAIVLSTACSPAPAPPPTPPSATSSPPKPSVSVSPSASTDPRGVEAAGAVVAFRKLIDRLSSNPSASLTALYTVARGDAADQYVQTINQYRADNLRQVGKVVVIPGATRRGSEGRYQVEACLDVSRTDVVDRRGRSTVAQDRASRLAMKYGVLRDSDAWFVTSERAVGEC
jgi:hypothetical protein